MMIAPLGPPRHRLPAARLARPILFEALLDIALCTALTALPERWYFRLLDLRRCEPGAAEAAAPASEAVQAAVAVGRAIEAVGRRVGFRAVCLQRALAARRMLRRRGIASTVHFGLRRKGGQDRARAGLGAHAWTTVGDVVVTGALPDLADYVVVGRYR